ncbi:MAG: 50S ribosomal protein L19 [Bacilli bacterium]|jgi:large subunit ribosomal protein L19|nr:50S ribosomal protein L19 [Bacilli bacterium]
MNIIEKITKKQIRTDLPTFQVGDTIIVGVKVREGNKDRIQEFKGIVMAIQGSGISKTFIVRKISNGVGVERTFPMNSPMIAYIKVERKGRVRQAKLGYLRNSIKQIKIKERN